MTRSSNRYCSRTAEAIVTGKVCRFPPDDIPNALPPVGPAPGLDRPEAAKPRSLTSTPDVATLAP